MYTKIHLRKNPEAEKLDGVLMTYRESKQFFSGVNFCMQTPGTYLHHTVSMVGLPDPVLLIFPSTCTEFTKIRENFEFTKTRARAPRRRHAVRKPASGCDQGHSIASELDLQGRVATKGYLRRRIAVTLSIFNFSS